MGTRYRVLAACVLGPIALGGVVACSSGGSGKATATTTEPKPATTSSTVPNPNVDQAAIDEAGAITKTLNAAVPGPCANPNFERNIQLPPEQHIPIPVTRASCTWDGGQVQVVAFADPPLRITYMQAWTDRLCGLANQNGERFLGDTYWIVNPRTATLFANKAAVDKAIGVVGGELHVQSCPAPTTSTSGKS